jgi:hypothetical protein
MNMVSICRAFGFTGLGRKESSAKRCVRSRKRKSYQRFLSNQRGAGKLTIAVFGTLLVAAIYTISEIGPIFYAYLEMENQMHQAVRVASIKTDAELRELLLPHMREQKIPAEPHDLIIERYATFITISLSYAETFSLPFGEKYYDIYTFHFDLRAKEEL